MHVIKLLLLALIVVAGVLGGFLVVAVLAAAAAVGWLARRYLIKPAAVQLPSRATTSAPRSAPALDVIDVTATEVPAGSREP